MRIKLFEIFKQRRRVSTDTRTLPDGAIYFALRGENFDGHNFIQVALDQGASYCVIDDPLYQNERTILVEDVLTALQQLATDYRRSLSAKVISLTGSNGKTTTKELIYCVLARQYKTYATPGNFNNHIGVPLTILGSPEDVEFLIVEMGANAQNEIESLCEIAEPDFGLITNIGKAHLEGFGGIEGVIKGKTEMYQWLDHQHKAAFINPNDPVLTNHFPTNLKKIEYLPFSLHHVNPTVQLKVEGHEIYSSLFGEYNAVNIIASVTIGNYFSIPWKDIQEGIYDYMPNNNRSTIKKMGKANVIFDAYNANPTSMELSLRNLAKKDTVDLILILGGMEELGEDAFEEHKHLVSLVDELGFTKVYYVGDQYKDIQVNNFFLDYNSLKKEAREWLNKKCTIFIKGSRKYRLEEIYK